MSVATACAKERPGNCCKTWRVDPVEHRWQRPLVCQLYAPRNVLTNCECNSRRQKPHHATSGESPHLGKWHLDCPSAADSAHAPPAHFTGEPMRTRLLVWVRFLVLATASAWLLSGVHSASPATSAARPTLADPHGS